MSWQKSLTNLFHTWRAEASSLTQRRLLTRPQDTHTTHRYEVGLSRSVFQGVISLTSQLLGIMEFDWWRSSRPLAPWMTLYTVSLGHSEMPRHFCYSFCFLPVFSGTTAWSMKHTSVTFFLLSKQNKTKKKSRLMTVSLLGKWVEKGGREWCLWIQFVPVCRCLSVPGRVFPALTVDLTPHWCTMCIQVKFSDTFLSGIFNKWDLFVWHFCAPLELSVAF